MKSLLIRGAQVYREHGFAAADVLVEDGVIAGLAGGHAEETLDGTGAYLCPGFIDVHTHDDRLLLDAPGGAHPKLSQEIAHRRDIGEFRHVGERQRFRAHQRRGHERQGRVLRAADGDFAVERHAALNPD